MQPPPQLKLRVLARVRQYPSPARREANARRRILIGCALLLPFVGFVALGGVRLGPRPVALAVETAFGTLVLAASSLWIVLGGGRMLGRSRATLLSVVAFWPMSLFLWKLGCSALSREAGALLAWSSRPGVVCFALTLLLGSLPLLGLSIARRRSDPTHPLSLGATLGVAAGCYSALLVDMWCPVGNPRHVLAGHVLPILILAGLGVAIGYFSLALRDQD